MKRTCLADRAEFLAEKQELLMQAARDMVKAEQANPVRQHEAAQARRQLLRAGLQFGLACVRYLGGCTA